MKKLKLNEDELASLIENIVEKRLSQVKEAPMDDEDFQEEEEFPAGKYDVDNIDFEISDSDMTDIDYHKGPMRKYRASIYIDGLVPMTDDVDYDRKLAKAIVDYYRKEMSNAETYIGGVGFKTKDISKPYDNMDF
jgi:hypothetical protein